MSVNKLNISSFCAPMNVNIFTFKYLEYSPMDKAWLILFNSLNEVQKRRMAALKAKDLGYGGVTTVANQTGFSRTTITKVMKELDLDGDLVSERIRRVGGGQKSISKTDPALYTRLEEIL